MTVERASGGGAGDFAAAEATWRNYCVVRKRDGRRHRVLSQLSIRIVFAIEGGSVQEMSFDDGELGLPPPHSLDVQYEADGVGLASTFFN